MSSTNPPLTESEFDANTFSNNIPPPLNENEFNADSFSKMNKPTNNNNGTKPSSTLDVPTDMKSLEAHNSHDEAEDGQGNGGLSDNEVLLDQTFRVWGQGQGHDYHVVLTPVSLLLQPTDPTPGQTEPPICCICPPMKCCGKCRRTGLCCRPKQMELLGRDIIACYPANHQLHQKPQTKLKSRGQGEDHLGYPVFMVIAYPANKNKKGKRVRSVLHFHLMPDSRLRDIDGKRRIRTESIGVDGSIVNGEAVQDDKDSRKLNRERMMTMFAAKLRDTWVHAITTTLFPDDAEGGACGYPSMSPGEEKRLLVIINPFAGTKQGQVVANRSLLPMLQQAGVEYEVLLTSHAGHARELVRQEASDRWKGIVCVSGDGLLYEVFNGLFDREDWREALECLSFGIVPAGSGNALSRSLVHLQREQFHPGTHDLSAAVNCARGSTRSMDLLYVETPMYGRLSFIGVFWGVIADIDIESEAIRWMGDARFTIYSLLKIIKCRRYRARLSYIPCDPEFTEATREILDEIHHKDPEDRCNPDESSSEDSNIPTSIKSKRSGNKISPSREIKEIEGDSLASDDIIIGNNKNVPPAVKSNGHHYHRQNSNKYVGDVDEDVSLPHAAPPGTYLIPRHVTYGTMLAQGQLYDRSWQELQANIMGSNKVHPAEYIHPPYGYQQMVPPPHAQGMPPSMHPTPHVSCPQHSHRIPSSMHPQQIPIDPPPSNHNKQKHLLKHQVSTSSSSYCAAAAAIKRSEDQSRPHFKDMPGILDPLPTNLPEGSNEWIVEQGTYLGAIVTNTPYIAEDFFVAPHSQLNDNQLCLVIFRGEMTRANLLKTLLHIEKGRHVGIPGIDIIPVSAVRIEPLDGKEGTGKMVVDGELIESGPIQCHIMQNAAKVFSK